MMFQVLHGRHSEGGMLYERGDVFESKSDLNKLNGGSHDTQKFLRMADDAKPKGGKEVAFMNETPVVEEEAEETVDLSSKTVAELRELAEEEEIDLGEATLKADIVEIIEAHLVG